MPADSQPAPAPVTAPPELRKLGLIHLGPVFANRSTAELVELAVSRSEGTLTDRGALVAYTGSRTGRSPQDRYIVRDPETEWQLDWGTVNRPLEPDAFERLLLKTAAYLQGRPLFVNDGFACADPRHRLNVRVVAEKAWHALFARCLFLRPTRGELPGFRPDWTILAAADLHADPGRDGTPVRGVHRPQPRPPARAHRRHALRRRDQEVGLLCPQLPAAAAGACSRCTARRTSARTGTWRCSSACRAPARRRCRPTRTGG